MIHSIESSSSRNISKRAFGHHSDILGNGKQKNLFIKEEAKKKTNFCLFHDDDKFSYCAHCNSKLTIRKRAIRMKWFALMAKILQYGNRILIIACWLQSWQCRCVCVCVCVGHRNNADDDGNGHFTNSIQLFCHQSLLQLQHINDLAGWAVGENVFCFFPNTA